MASGTDDITERIRRVALRRFAEVGYGSATVDDIAAGANVGVATLYRRWPDKQALANDLMADYLNDLDNLYQPLSAPTPKRRFNELWDRLWRLAMDEPDRFIFGQAHAHATFLSEELSARKAAKAVSAKTLFDQLGMGATPETAGSIITGTLTAIIQDDLDLDQADLAERLWSALQPR